MPPRRPALEIYLQWKEDCIVRCGDEAMVFFAGMGVNPVVVHLPKPDLWKALVPGWAADRMEEIIARIEGLPGVGPVRQDEEELYALLPASEL